MRGRTDFLPLQQINVEDGCLRIRFTHEGYSEAVIDIASHSRLTERQRILFVPSSLSSL